MQSQDGEIVSSEPQGFNHYKKKKTFDRQQTELQVFSWAVLKFPVCWTIKLFFTIVDWVTIKMVKFSCGCQKDVISM